MPVPIQHREFGTVQV
uniref:Uncharacterized protein n=1 Tax=Anguilla anguilla TaxID=7936 RepID=A0A0E9VZ52_ANGAN